MVKYMVHISDAFEIDGFIEQKKELEALLMSNPAMEKKVQGLIRKVLTVARREIGMDATKVIKNDPRKAYQAVKTTVYRQILGGNVSLYPKKRASALKSDYEPERTLQEGQRGGNRRRRNQRTINLQSYMGSDRGFVLRFLEAGVNNRTINFKSDPAREKVKRGSRGGNIQKYGRTINTGRRGNIAPRNFFGNSSQKAMQKAAEQLTELIDELIRNQNL